MSNRLGLLENEESEDFFAHVKAEFAYFEGLVYEELVKRRWTTPAARATAQARQAGELAAVRLRATAHSAGQPLQALGFELLRLKRIAQNSQIPPDLREELLELHDKMEKHLGRLGGAIRRFADEEAPRYQEVQVLQLLERAAALVSSLADTEKAEILILDTDDRLKIVVPDDLIVGAVQELLTNAIVAPRPPGRQPKVELSAAVDGTDVVLVVADNAEGILGKGPGDDVLGVPSTSGRPAEGLPTVENSVKVSGGKVWIRRTGASGTEILIELRRAPRRA
jgi:C4-dicarboxylate-specific signal transduction histidine kinase